MRGVGLALTLFLLLKKYKAWIIFYMSYNIVVNFINKNWRKLILIAGVFIVPAISFAEGKINDPLGGRYTSVPGLIKTFLEGALRIGMPVVALAVVYCGFLFVSARGNPEKLTKAKDALVWTLIGAAILLGSWAIAEMIEETVLDLTLALFYYS